MFNQTIANLFYRYAEHIDAGELTATAELLKHCTIFDPYGNELAKGNEQILEMYRGLVRIYPDNNTPHTNHVLSNLIIEQPSNEVIKARASFTVMQKMESEKIETIMCGQYRSLFRQVDGEWAFIEHRMYPKLIGDMSEHLLLDVTAGL